MFLMVSQLPEHRRRNEAVIGLFPSLPTTEPAVCHMCTAPGAQHGLSEW